MSPQRVQRMHTKGWRMPENTVYVGRGSKWGNPYPVGDSQWTPQGFKLWASYRDVVEAHRDDITTGTLGVPKPEEIRALAGKNLACWCPLNQPCHAEVLLEIANTQEWMNVDRKVLYWPGERSEHKEPKNGIIIAAGVAIFGGTACVRIRTQQGHSDFIQLSHIEPTP
ncbi:hypothetical protein ANMWB30_24710 [Arthrobacter sp. MWB30]|nr:hypothetical protein ANMWB30_24710 [Arthrobacter sp. MWB30]